jgi:hypothetical protein
MQVPTAITANTNHTAVTKLAGFSIREAAGIAAVATVRLRRAAVGGTIIEVIELPANGSLTVSYGRGNYKEASGGTYVEVVAGTVEGTLFQDA